MVFTDTIMSDNGTQFRPDKFRKFCKRFAIKYVTTPPYHPKLDAQAGAGWHFQKGVEKGEQ